MTLAALDVHPQLVLLSLQFHASSLHHHGGAADSWSFLATGVNTVEGSVVHKSERPMALPAVLEDICLIQAVPRLESAADADCHGVSAVVSAIVPAPAIT